MPYLILLGDLDHRWGLKNKVVRVLYQIWYYLAASTSGGKSKLKLLETCAKSDITLGPHCPSAHRPTVLLALWPKMSSGPALSIRQTVHDR